LAEPVKEKVFLHLFTIPVANPERSTTPVRLVHNDNTFIIPLTYGERADWYKNLMTSGMMKITWQGQIYEVGNPERLEVNEAIDDFPWISQSLFKQEGLPAFIQVSIVQ